MKKKFGWLIDRTNNFYSDNINYDGVSSVFFDGYVTNKEELCNTTEKSAGFYWKRKFEELINDSEFPNNLRGGFCGFKSDDFMEISLFVDHTGNRPLYYYYDKRIFLLSNRMNAIIRFLQLNNIKYTINQRAIEYFLEFGFLLDDSTLVQNVKRVEPGTIVEVDFNKQTVSKKKYYYVDNEKSIDVKDYDELIFELDYYFKQAIERQFKLDAHFNRKSVVELSGGLDSRMTTLVANELGYENQLSLICAPYNHLDYSIAIQVADYFGNDVVAYEINDCKWMDEISETLFDSNWSCNFMYAAPLRYCYRTIDLKNCGGSHTGTLGDAILSTIYNESAINFAKPKGKENAYTKKLTYKKNINPLYNNNEKYSINVTGMLGIQSSNIWKNNYLEWNSPFMDVDLMDFIFKIPFRLRSNYKIYLDWIERFHETATKFGWEKWNGFLPTKEGRKEWIKSGKSREYQDVYSGCIVTWDKKYNEYFLYLINECESYIDEKLLNDSKVLYNTGFFHEKCMAISVLESIYQIEKFR